MNNLLKVFGLRPWPFGVTWLHR